MTNKTFDELADLHRLRGKTREAVRLVIVEGMTRYAAAKEAGMNESALGRAVNRYNRAICKCCGQPVKS